LPATPNRRAERRSDRVADHLDVVTKPEKTFGLTSGAGGLDAGRLGPA